MKAFLGMGLLGANFVKAMLKKGENVQVWNRTAAKATALEAFGAKAFANSADAVKGANRIHLTLKDDASVDEVLAAASPGFEPGAIIIDHTTTSAPGAVKRTNEWKAKGYTYLHAPVFMGPSNALDGTGNMLVSGDQLMIAQLEAELSGMTGKLINLGPQEGKAAGMKLIGNLFLLTLTAGISDTLALAKSLGIAITDVSALFDSFNPGASMPARLKRIATGKFDEPSWELTMARKDAGLMMDAASGAHIPLTVIPTIAKEMDDWIKKGFGNSDWSIIAKNSL
jgi:3-hydroxyisobutyrate dehydrogenase